MSVLLVDSLYAVASPDFAGKLASSLGEPAASITRGLHSGMSSLLAGLLRKSSDSSAMQGIFNTVNSSVNDGQILNDPASLIGATPSSSPISALGGQFASTVFGNRGSAVNEVVARNSGLRGSLASTLMQLAAPLVLAMLGRRVREGNLNVTSFTRLISSERDSIARAAPPGIASALGIEDRGPSREFEVPRRERVLADAPLSRASTAEPVSKKTRVWPVVATLGALALVWAIWPKGHNDVPVTDTSRSAYSGGEVVAPVVIPVPNVPSTSSSPRIQLPNGTALMVAESGPEGRIVGILNDPSTPADVNTAFVLERIQFESNSAKLRAESDAQIKDIAAILAAFPNAAVKVGGHTDNKGSAAANLKLSRDRASSVKRALVAEGVSDSRVTTEGFGSMKPVADNSTEEGRARNRRIALVVTKKQ